MTISYIIQYKGLEGWYDASSTTEKQLKTHLNKYRKSYPKIKFRAIQRIQSIEEVVLF